MKTPARYTLKLLGTPHVEGLPADAPHLKRSLSWCILARLVECGDWTANATLQAEFCVGSAAFKQAIYDCTQTFGKSVFECQGRTRRLHLDAFTTDCRQFEILAKQARQAKADAEKITLLREALALVRGDFLAGCAKDASDFDWVSEQQAIWRGKYAEVGRTLIALLEQEDQPREALEVAQRLAELVPQDNSNRMTLLSLSHVLGLDLNAPRDGSLAEWVAFIRKLTRSGHSVTLSEKAQAECLLRCEYEQLKEEAERLALRQLSVFEGQFDAEWTQDLFGISEQQLSDFAGKAFLTEYDGVYEMPELWRKWIHDRLRQVEKEKYQSDYCAGVLKKPFRVFRGLKTEKERQAHLAFYRPHYDFAFFHLLHQLRANKRSLGFEKLDYLFISLARFFPERWAECDDATRQELTRHAFNLPILMAHHSRSWQESLTYSEALLAAMDKEDALNQYIGIVGSKVMSLHRIGDSLAAAELGMFVFEKIKNSTILDPYQQMNGIVRFGIMLGEILSALGRHEEALIYSDAAIEESQKPEFQGSIAPALYNKGIAWNALKERDKAVQAWNTAFEMFRHEGIPHGIADCKQRLGVLMAEMGLFLPGEDLVREALQIYEQIPQMQSRAACLRSLGEVLKRKNDLEGARAAFCEGLEFWENEVTQGRNGSGWVKRFQSSLANLD